MKPGKTSKDFEGRSVYERMTAVFFDSNPVEDLNETVHQEFMGYGTAAHEFMNEKKVLIEMARTQSDQIRNSNIEVNRKIIFERALADSTSYLIVEEFDFHDVDNGHHYSMRLSTILEKTDGRWLVSHMHGSTPDSNIAEEEALPMEGLRRKNRELEEKIKEGIREAELEAALERIRSSSLAMRKPDDLRDVVTVLFEQMQELSVDMSFASVSIFIFKKGTRDFTQWLPLPDGVTSLHIPYIDHPITSDLFDARESGAGYFEKVYSVAEKNVWLEKGFDLTDYKNLPDEFKTSLLEAPGYAMSISLAKHSGICIPSFEGKLPSPENVAILKRVGKVFEQAYTRFLDLQKAEAQAREAKIETALEKVRSRSLAMHKSDELNEVVSVLFEKLKELQIPFTAVGIATRIEGSKDLNAFVCGQNEAGLVITNYRLPYFDNPIPKDLYNALEKQLDFYVGHYSKEEKDAFYNYVIENTAEFRHLPEDIKRMIFDSTNYTISSVAVKNAVFNVNDFEGKTLTDNEVDIIKRFARVFDQAYTRFLDLKKAEAQAREAEIQLALERVRARAMAMQKSDELSDVIALISEQMNTLQIPVDDGVALITFDEDSKDLNEWMANEGFETATNFHLPYFDHPVLSNLWEAKDQGQKELIQRYSAEESRSFLNHIFQHTDFSHTPEPVKEYCLAAETYATSIAFQKNTAIFINDYSGVSLSDSEMAILHRFAKEFDQTYTRFLDLQKAEAQARESEVNLAVERVRAKALAMFKSEEILQVVIKLRNEIMGLNIPNVTAATIHLKEPNGMVRAWDLTSINNEEGQKLEISLDITYRLEDTHPDFFMREVWEKTDDYFVVIQGKYRYKHTSQWLRENGHAAQAQEFEEFVESSQIEKAYHPTVPLNNGRMCIDMLEPPDPEVESILKKMAGAFDLAYKRFQDLQKAEAQTREAQIEAALERARAQNMMMQHSDEINSISNAFHEQLVLLGIPSEFSYVWLPDEENQSLQFWASWYEREAGENSLQSKQVTYPLDKSEPYTAACFEAWATPDVILEEFIPPQDIAGFFDVWQELLSGAKKLKTEYFPEGIYYSEAYMRYGCFGINIRRKLSEEEKNILKRFSKEFERAYTRFLDLQTAEKQALVIREERDRLEVALNKLEATQDQLIQQEKLASLGQLTAGIAHEIKNPLNFVNNFSEVSVELIEEAREEVRRVTDDQGPGSEKKKSLRQPEEGAEVPDGTKVGDDAISAKDETTSLLLEILDDIEANLRKIHEHGSRADGIVKSMLQHSRGGNGKMEPEPLNPIIKEYVNLAFHGMRAGKEPINVAIDLQLDESIGEVPLIAEDFSRVILNVCNNAFDAMREKAKGKSEKSPFEGGKDGKAGQGDDAELKYSPKLSIRTKSSTNAITIEIEDNGPGIPDEIRDKIMQPFFTTKKGTQGTGLGLSITNDIVKAHGGVLNVSTQAGKRTTFNIELPK
jgi:signal transduction histidine kinase